MKFETILDEVSGFGPFQIIIVVLLCSPRMVLPLHFMLTNFIAVAPPHRCDISSLADGGLFGNLTQEQRLTVGIPQREDGGPRSCEMFAEPQFQLLSNSSISDNMLELRSKLTSFCLTGEAGTYKAALITSSSDLLSQWDLVCDRKSLTKTSSSIFFFGVMLGAVAFGFLCDKFGRKNTLLASYIMSMVFGFSTAFANSFVLFSALRFLTGFALTGLSLNSLVLSKSFISVIGSLTWCVGNMLLAGIAFLVTDWRTLTMAVTAPLGLAVLTWWVPESARWLLANGKVEEAQFYLDRCAKINRRQKMSSSFKLEVSACEKQGRSYSYLDLIRTPKLRWLTLYGVASTYYSLSLSITGFGLNIYLTHFIYAAIEVPAKLTVYYVVNVFGRRKCQAGTLMLTAACVAINIFMPKGRSGVLVSVDFSVCDAVNWWELELFIVVYQHQAQRSPHMSRKLSRGQTVGAQQRLNVSLCAALHAAESEWLLIDFMFVFLQAAAKLNVCL
uniref:Solute carrier family 22 member 7-like n=1 Tax=Stegastes partitus TaxID=144197 RepID=A0A3B5A8Z1_9TELE